MGEIMAFNFFLSKVMHVYRQHHGQYPTESYKFVVKFLTKWTMEYYPARAGWHVTVNIQNAIAANGKAPIDGIN